jgi:hypothetical protein
MIETHENIKSREITPDMPYIAFVVHTQEAGAGGFQKLGLHGIFA